MRAGYTMLLSRKVLGTPGRLLLACLLAILAAIPLFSREPATILKVKVAKANVRVSPDPTSQVLGQLPKGTLLEAKAKVGDWYEISFQDAAGTSRQAYINSLLVEIIGDAEAAAEKTEEKPGRQETPAEEGPDLSVGGQHPPLGWFAKFGIIDKGWGDWTGSLGFDFALMKYLSLGLEIMPSSTSLTRDEDQFKASSLMANAFLNLKAGTNLSLIKPEMDFMTVYGGLGGGIHTDYTKTTLEGSSSSLFSFAPALHAVFGFELQAKSVGLVFEYQIVRVLDPDINPDAWIGYLVFGLRF